MHYKKGEKQQFINKYLSMLKVFVSVSAILTQYLLGIRNLQSHT